MPEVREMEELIARRGAFVGRIREWLALRVVGQSDVVDKVAIALLCNAHILLEGVPGLAKTLLVRTFAEALDLSFQRLQFTPDMLPADLTGTMVYHPRDMEFSARKGPLFAQVVLADEINRAPAKVQSALLEAMEERQVTIGSTTFRLPEPFMVLATQNPLEHEGTYQLPEAQLDRFMMKVIITYPSYQHELEVMERSLREQGSLPAGPVAGCDELLQAKAVLGSIRVDRRIVAYAADLVGATRDPVPAGIPSLEGMIEHGASPRASIFLLHAARAHAFLSHRPYVVPEDIKAVVYDVLRHRLRLDYEAEVDRVSVDQCISEILRHVHVP
ncbi:magnesium chelatase ATPase subunit D [Prosthecochloris sp. CIB 2401]|uniref:AAA family ATPase n=1 Tax=Prosthecochloris vibrioformis TaxID=1098 RepID=A0A5C4S4T0_PROVB|nr:MULTISPECIES: AAA family ATPase [Prosthecochloris]ANT65870.1 magnesium chelatase ATPase subunit D [Prosthecochloris sp. CIB 2401]TNJ38157.1 AAA family ATPase [Prosthecochloris vibrioformis]